MHGLTNLKIVTDVDRIECRNVCHLSVVISRRKAVDIYSKLVLLQAIRYTWHTVYMHIASSTVKQQPAC